MLALALYAAVMMVVATLVRCFGEVVTEAPNASKRAAGLSLMAGALWPIVVVGMLQLGVVVVVWRCLSRGSSDSPGVADPDARRDVVRVFRRSTHERFV